MRTTSSTLLSATVLAAGIASLPGLYAQVTVVEFGGDDLVSAIPQLNSELGVVSASTGVSPVGTANGGSETTFKYEEIDVFSTDGVVSTLTATGTLIASSSGYKLSVAVPVTTEGVTGQGVVFQGCEFIDQDTGRCSAAIFAEAEGQTITVGALTTTGTPLPTTFPAIADASGGGNGGGNNGGKDDNAASLSTSKNVIGIAGTIITGILLGSLRVL
ncbi:hypothetical protein K435DRAFT_800267 [Dendrothele bispora CBS 962.96]|uniref:Uncharacterized protein n=1 Tax=Dendrothele bispora (strain CBS 962.96) TaxID=1314807 RepID=A0A4S8LUM2_DENBC|nr:hypothetical protein K435DRAFT_800267 [Dendrothele bispora CBS 962.96]